MKKNYFKFAIFMAVAVLVTFTACDKDDDDNNDSNSNDSGNIIVSDNITSDETWTNDNIYQLGGRIAVEDGATLTIEPGTIIKGEAGTGPNATALIIARGGKLNAVGTASEPIIFTTVADEITLQDVQDGNFASPNLEPNVNGLWGGLIVLGKAPISASNDNDQDVSETQIEGIPATDPNGLYGGNVSDDNSGNIQYISIRHGGSNIGQGNEINGITLGGVGTGTTVENIEIVSNQDDGIEFFGGTVNVTNLVSWNVNDDGIDTDQSWSGTIDNFVVITAIGHSFELDGAEGSMEATHTLRNGNVYASSADTTEDGDPVRKCIDLFNVDDNTKVNAENILFTGVVDGQKIEIENASNQSFNNVLINVDASNLDSHINGTNPGGISAGNTSQANESVFTWTWAKQAGAF